MAARRAVGTEAKEEAEAARDESGSCPWCGSDSEPVPTDLEVAEFRYSDPKEPSSLRRNPAMCPDCHGVGGWEDWG